MSHDNFGSFWSANDKAVIRDKWPSLGSYGVQPLIESKRTPKSIENEAYRMGLKRVTKDGKPIRNRSRGALEGAKEVREREAAFGAIETGPVASVFHLATAMGVQP